MLRVAAGVSGSGTTALYLMKDMLAGGSLHGKACMPVVIPSRLDCDAIGHFRERFPDSIIDPADRGAYASEEMYAGALIRIFETYGIDVYGQYGLVVKTPVNRLPKEIKVINQHPVPLVFGGQGFYGLTTHAAILAYMRIAGLEFMYSECVTHVARDEYDDGPVIMRVRVPVRANMTPAELQRLTIGYEWQCQTAALHRICDEGWPLDEFPKITRLLVPSIVEEAKQIALETYPH